MDKKPGWKDIPIGGKIIHAGNSHDYHTGGWRTFLPIYDADQCINCLTCFYMCPDSSIKVKDGKMLGINYDHCKGCGICARECPITKRELKKPEADRKFALRMELEEN